MIYDKYIIISTVSRVFFPFSVKKDAIPCLKLATDHEQEEYVLCDSDVPVGANICIGEDDHEEEKIELNNRGMKKRARTQRWNDHDYTVNAEEVYAMRHYISRLEAKLKKSQIKCKKRTRQLSQSQASTEKWKAKAIQRGKALKQKQTNTAKPDGLLGELFRNSKRSVHGVRYSNRTKNIALAIYYCSPNAYQMLRKQLRLPSKSLIKRWLGSLDIREGFSDNILTLMTEQAKNLPVQARVVEMLVDETKMKPNWVFHEQTDSIVGFPTQLPGRSVVKEQASSVLVVMIKTILTGKKQCIGFFFSKNGFKSDELTVIINASIERVVQTGYIPKVLINDQNSTNQALLKGYGVTVDRPYFEVNGSRIYAMYDPPHLLKSARNNLMHHNGIYKNQIVKWDHIRLLFEEDRKHLDRAAPKITPEHLDLPVFTEMRVSIAAETLSETVFSATKLYVEAKALPAECMHTAEYCRDMNNLFDTFNSSSSQKDEVSFLTFNPFLSQRFAQINRESKLQKLCVSMNNCNGLLF